MDKIVLELLFSFFDIFILTSFSDIFLPKKEVKTINQILGVVAASVLVFLFSYLPIFSYASAILIVGVTILYIFLLYDGPMRRKVMTGIMFQLLYGMYSLITFACFSFISDAFSSYLFQYNSPIRLGFVVFTRGVAYFSLLGINKKRMNKTYNNLFDVHLLYISLIFLSIVFVITNMLIFNKFNASSDSLILLIGLIVLFFFAIYMEKNLIANTTKINQLEKQNQALEIQQVYYESKKEQDLEIRRVKHDLKNNLFVLETLLKDKKYDDAEKYLNELTNLPALEKRIITGNDTLDAFFNISIQTNPTVKFKIDINIKELNINSSSISTIVGNALTNAIEAVNKLNEDIRNITVTINENDKRILMRFENNYKDDPEIENGNFITSKTDTKNHGLGLYSIRKEIEKYNGKMTYEVDKCNKIFKLNVLLLK